MEYDSDSEPYEQFEVKLTEDQFTLFDLEPLSQSAKMFEHNLNRQTKNWLPFLEEFYISHASSTYQQVYNELTDGMFSMGTTVNVPYCLLSSLRPFTPEAKEKIVSCVHGPFPDTAYFNEDFVDQYVIQKHNTRVADIAGILISVKSNILALGDGAGTAYQACAQLRGEGSVIECISYDHSETMIAKATQLGNKVSLGDFNIPLPEGYVYFLSHVIDYLPDDFFLDKLDKPIIIFEKNLTFKNCHYFTPYMDIWGYQICTRNFVLNCVLPASTLTFADNLDYSMLGVLLPGHIGTVNVSEGCEQYQNMCNSYLTLEGDNESFIWQDGFEEIRGASVGIPFCGVIDNVTAPRFGAVCPEKLQAFFMHYGGYFTKYATYVQSTFFADCDEVYARQGALRVKQKKIYVGTHVYYKVKKKFKVVDLIRCRCFGNASHTHVLKIVPGEYVEWKNLVGDMMRFNYLGLVRNKIYEFFYSNYTGEYPLEAFTALELAANARYDKDNNLITDARTVPTNLAKSYHFKL